MKKLVIAAAIVCAAVVSQAAMVSWACDWAYSNYGSVNTYDAPDEMTYWIVNMASATDTTGLSVDKTGALVNKDSYAIVGTGSFTENGNGVAEGTIANGNYLAMVIYDAANKLYGVSDANAVSGIVVDPPTAGTLAVDFQFRSRPLVLCSSSASPALRSAAAVGSNDPRLSRLRSAVPRVKYLKA